MCRSCNDSTEGTKSEYLYRILRCLQEERAWMHEAVETGSVDLYVNGSDKTLL